MVRVWIVCIWAVLLGCTRPRTQLVVCVGTDMAQPASVSARPAAFAARIEQVCGLQSVDNVGDRRLESLRVELRSSDGSIAQQWSIDLGLPEEPAQNRLLLPRDLMVIEPRDGDLSRRALLRVVGVVGARGSTAASTVTRDSIVSFAESKTLRVSIFLPAACAGITCPVGQTCGEGGTCVSNAALLPVEIPSQPTIADAGPMTLDAARFDAGASDAAAGDVATDDPFAAYESGVGPVIDRDAALYADVPDPSLGANDPFMGCRPAIGRGTDVGGRCLNLPDAWTAREINIGYFPFRATQGALIYYTDSDADRVNPGDFVALASAATNYSPVCSLDTCSESTGSCATRSPPLAEGIQDSLGNWYFWGYPLAGTDAHTMGWIRAMPRSLVFVGNTTHPTCAFGPAAGGGNDFEASAGRCGSPDPRCAMRTCGGQNRCSEGNDDCGRRCGASVPPPIVGEPIRRVTRTEPTLMTAWGIYIHWAQGASAKSWLPYGTSVRIHFRNIDRGTVIWDLVEVLASTSRFAPPGLRGWVRDDYLR